MADVFYAGALSMLIENDEDVKLSDSSRSWSLSEHPRVTGIRVSESGNR
jgi:hypothetical protein